jgi:hypothetical protein
LLYPSASPPLPVPPLAWRRIWEDTESQTMEPFRKCLRLRVGSKAGRTPRPLMPEGRRKEKIDGIFNEYFEFLKEMEKIH